MGTATMASRSVANDGANRDIHPRLRVPQDTWLVWYAPYLLTSRHDSPERYYEIAKQRPGIEPHELPYYAAIAQFDETVGRLIDFVETNSDPANTIFVFVADNGWSPSKEPERNRAPRNSPTPRRANAPLSTRECAVPF